jgi:periplasmic protein CpxP/Spy
MKHVFFSASLTLALAGTLALAQSAPATPDTTTQKGYHRHHHAPDPHRAALRVGQRLGLSADQTAKLEPIFADSQQKIAALRSDTSLSPDQKRQQFRAIHENTKTQLATVLTPDQMQQLRNMRHNHRRGQEQQSSPTAPQPGS